MMTVRIVVADDHQVVRAGFAALLDSQPDFTVVGTARDGAEAVRLGRELRPDVVLMDVRMPGTDGIEATRQLAEGKPDGPRILILTTFDLDDYVFDALRAGASGFLLKDVTAERLFDAVRVVAAGEALLAPAVTRRLISEFARLKHSPVASPAAAYPQLASLTPRETEVFSLVAGGLSNHQIAGRLVVTEETVKTHVSRVLHKLGLRDRTQAVIAAYESGMVVPGSHGSGEGYRDRLSRGSASAARAGYVVFGRRRQCLLEPASRGVFNERDKTVPAQERRFDPGHLQFRARRQSNPVPRPHFGRRHLCPRFRHAAILLSGAR